MKRLLTIMVCLFAMLSASLGAKAQEITFLLRPGWNWIAYPYPESASIETAFGDFEPVSGDIIESEFGYSEYFEGYGWFGGIYNLEPGKGYIYYSNRTVPVTIVFGTPSSQSQVTVTTSEPLLITAISAMCGGQVTTTDGTYILVKGLCWATHENPTTNDDFYQEAESGVGSFSISMTELNLATTYYVRAYAVTSNDMVYGDQKTFTTRDGIPAVSTDSVTNILGNGATCNSTVTDNGGLNVIARGVCWSTEHNPTLSDSHSTNGTGLGSFTSTMTGMELGTFYYVRAYASTSAGTGYGEEVSFTTQSSTVCQYVDLGLPSGILWATCNVGADTPEDYGAYFAWGETQPKEVYDWSTYQHCNGNWNELTKYCNDTDCGYNGYSDNLTTLLPEDDAATSNWGAGWRMPTHGEWLELFENTTNMFTDQNGVNGMLFIALNGNSIFLPATYDGSSGDYLSSSLYIGNPYMDCPCFAYDCFIDSSLEDGALLFEGADRSGRCSVRPVRSSQGLLYSISANANPAEGGNVTGIGEYEAGSTCTLTATAEEGFTFINWTENGEVVSVEANYSFTVTGDRSLLANFTMSSGNDHDYVDLGLPSGTLWATCNVGADYPEGYGDCFAWGETQPKNVYNWSTYQYCHGSSSTLMKYCNNPSYGYNGFIDNLSALLPEDDAATANWGDDWRMPTKEEWQELYVITTCTWTTQNGVDGRLFTAPNGNTLFLPAAGYRSGSNLSSPGADGDYLSSSLYTDNPSRAWEFNFGMDNYGASSFGHRKLGLPVRAVRSSSQSQSYVDLGLPSGTLWATCNLGAVGPTDFGDYFAWGETQSKEVYNWSTYQHCNGSSSTLTKYCYDSDYGYNGFIDNLTVLSPEDDAATINWGDVWRMPTEEEWFELCNNTEIHPFSDHNGEGWIVFTAANGKSLLLPYNFRLDMMGGISYYWTNSLLWGCADWPTPDGAVAFGYSWCMDELDYRCDLLSREMKGSIRPVRSAPLN